MKNRLDDHGIPHEFYLSGPLTFHEHILSLLRDKFKDDMSLKWMNHPNEIAVTLAHLNLMQKMKAYGWKRMLVFEDDTLLRDDFVPAFCDAFEELGPHEFDVAHLVVNQQTPDDDNAVDHYWNRTKGSTLACAYVLDDRYVDRVMEHYKDRYSVLDVFFYFDSYESEHLFLADPICIPDPNTESSITGEVSQVKYVDDVSRFS